MVLHGLGHNLVARRMANIIVVDDDYALEIVVDTLRGIGHDVHRIRSVDDALKNITNLASSDLVVLDVMMPIPAKRSSTDSGRTAGMLVYRSLRKHNSTVPVIAYTASHDLEVHAVFDRDPNTDILPKWSTPSMEEIISRVEQALGISPSAALPRTFIVHGHDDTSKLALKNYLQNTLHLPEPTILHEQPGPGGWAARVYGRDGISVRYKVLSFVASLPPCVVAMEACASSHHWGREIGSSVMR